MSYSSSTYLTAPVGNNQFAYAPRLATGTAQVFIPAIKEIVNGGEIELGKEIVFAEVDTHGKVRTCTGLAHLYVLTQETLPPIWIMDNHHHALYARVKWYTQNPSPLTIVHIDAHADLTKTSVSFDSKQKEDETYLRHYANEICTIASFIQPLIDVGIVKKCMQVRTSSKLHEIASNHIVQPYILDIDLDFFALPQEAGAEDEQIAHLQSLLTGAELCTIATSPYFMDQQRALQLLQLLLKY